MRSFYITLFLALCFASIKSQISPPKDFLTTDLIQTYRRSIYKTIVLSWKAVARHSQVNFALSPRSIWIMIAAIAEGTDENTQEQLLKLLNLPNDPSIREKYYQIATSRILPDSISITEIRALIIDDNSHVNRTWLEFVSKNNLLDVVRAPIKSNPDTTKNEIKRIMEADLPRLDLSGNSILLNLIDYNTFWSTIFTDAAIERSPFYSQSGELIGTVDLMRMKRKARLGFIKSMNSKALELTIGSKYRIIFLILLERDEITRLVANIQDDILFEMFESFEENSTMVDIGIPRLEITSEINVRAVLEDLGVSSLWTDPDATKYITSPPALPSSYIQRATLTLNNYGTSQRDGKSNGLESEYIVNQPFLFGLFDVETNTPLLAMACTVPTYR